ncbi:MAG: acyloxyacyl hydrolase, partial [Bacteroidia bacterium]
FGLGANFQFRIAGKGKNYLAWRLGTGIGYLTQKFDFYKNRQNMAIGSNWNGCIQMGLIYQTKISNKLSLKTGLGFTHYSNGSIRVPNLGVNMPSLFLGLQMGYGKPANLFTDSTNAFKTTTKPNEILFNYAFKERFTAKPIPFHIFSLGYRWNKPISSVRRWYLGADLVWDPTHPYSHFLFDDNPRVGIDNSTELGVLIGHRYDIGAFAMLTDVGFYLLNPYQTKYFSYQRIGFRYELNKDWFVNGTLKVHFGTADYFEWGLGYKFKKFRK